MVPSFEIITAVFRMLGSTKVCNQLTNVFFLGNLTVSLARKAS
jgi:hypothetical protein